MRLLKQALRLESETIVSRQGTAKNRRPEDRNMNKNRILCSAAISITLIIFLLGACSTATPSPESQTTPEPVTIKVAVIPVMDTLALYVAQQESLYAKYNVKVEFIPVGSAPERDQLIAASQADAMINEVVSTLFYNREITQVQIVRYARTASAEAPLFHILAAAQSGITTPDGLRGVEIGISQGTIIEYLTDRLLQAQGFSNEEIKVVAVPKISDRMSLLASGEVQAAMLPDPLTFLAQQQGAVIVLDDATIPELSFSTLTIRKAFIDEHPEAVRGFLAAIEEATALLNAEPEKYYGLLSEQKLVPETVLEGYKLGAFPTAGVPTEAQWNDVMAWAQEKGLLDVDVSYKESVTAEYLP